MKTPLRYQMTDYDCGTTSVLNALIALFERHEIPPELVREITARTLDRYHEGRPCRAGTSGHAMRYLGWWLNDYAGATGFPLRARYLGGDEVTLAEGSPVRTWVEAGGVAVVGCRFLCVDHYVTLTGIEGDDVLLFDPSYAEPEVLERMEGVRGDELHPLRYNRVVSASAFRAPGERDYSLACRSGRDALLVARSDGDSPDILGGSPV